MKNILKSDLDHQNVTINGVNYSITHQPNEDNENKVVHILATREDGREVILSYELLDPNDFNSYDIENPFEISDADTGRVNMRYSVDISNDVYSLSYCLKKISDKINEFEDWKICININYPTDRVFLNFDIDNKDIQINSKQSYDILQDLDTVFERVKKINSGYMF